MPYKKGNRLPGEKASKIGHLDVLKSPLVNEICSNFEESEIPNLEIENLNYISVEKVLSSVEVLNDLWVCDGSFSKIENYKPPYKAVTFVKTSLLHLNKNEMNKSDHPFDIAEMLEGSVSHHSTIFPLKNIGIKGMSNYDAIRHLIFQSMKDESLNEMIFETLKWLLYEKWNEQSQKNIESFICPHCGEETGGMAYDTEKGICETCQEEILLTDALGFHLDMNFDFTPEHITEWYMLIHEVLFLFSSIRCLWEENKDSLSDALFIKDGPFTLYRQYGKLVVPIRNFLSHAQKRGYSIYFVGQEKTGIFVDHFKLIADKMPNNSIFIPNDTYIKKHIQQRPNIKGVYGESSNYGVKIFFKLSHFDTYVLNIPVSEYTANPSYDDLIGIEKILSTIQTIKSHLYEGALMPIGLVNSAASLSFYPSSKILEKFLESKQNKK